MATNNLPLQKWEKDLQWLILPGRTFNSCVNILLYNQIYSHWWNTWSTILEEKKSLTSENFLFQDLLCPLLYKENVIGLITINFFDLRLQASFHHPHLKLFPRDHLHNLAKDQIVMTIGYLSIAKHYRKNKINFSLGEVLLGLSMKFFATTSCPVVLGTANYNAHVDKLCYKFGFQSLGKAKRFGLPCVLIINTKATLCSHPLECMKDRVDLLWNKRYDFTQNVYSTILQT